MTLRARLHGSCTRLLEVRAAPTAAARHHARLIAGLCLAALATDALGALQCSLFAPGIERYLVPPVVAGGALLSFVAFAVNRSGRRGLAVLLLTATQMLVPSIVTLRVGWHDDAAALTLALWSTPALAALAAFASREVLLAAGLGAMALLLATLGLVHGLHAGSAVETLAFLVTFTGLLATAARHRERLDALHREELEVRNAELQRLRESLEAQVAERTRALLSAEKMAAIGRLTAGIAHEMSSPLAAIVAALADLERLRDEYESSIGDASVDHDDHRAIAAEMTECLSLGQAALDRSVAFVRSIKAQTRVGAATKPETFDAGVLVRDCVPFVAPAARAARCKLDVRVEVEEGLSVHGLPARLNQVMANLLQNAIDATGERGGGDIVTTVGRDLETGHVVIRVADQGGGIADAILPHIFEPLFTTKPYGKGTGLGLAMAKEAVERDLGGRIRVETEPGLGSTFLVELPPASRVADAA